MQKSLLHQVLRKKNERYTDDGYLGADELTKLGINHAEDYIEEHG